MLNGISMVGQLCAEIFDQMAKKFDVHPRAIRRVWQRAVVSKQQYMIVEHEILSRNINRGYKRKRWKEEALLDAVKDIPYRMRMTWDALSEQVGVPVSTLRDMKGIGLFCHTSPLKPCLKDKHHIARLDQCISKMDPDNPSFYRNLYDEGHVDKKWFYLTEDGTTLILADGKPLPKRKVRHKNFITKIMLLCAQARPRMLNGTYWDGKIGIWPIGRIGVAKRNSTKRPAGTPVWESETVDKDKYRQLLISEVLPAIIAKFPWSYVQGVRGRSVKIQQDGAKSHIENNDEEWLEAVAELGVNVHLSTQAAQSPDLNINDLAFFRSIMSLKRRAAP